MHFLAFVVLDFPLFTAAATVYTSGQSLLAFVVCFTELV